MARCSATAAPPRPNSSGKPSRAAAATQALAVSDGLFIRGPLDAIRAEKTMREPFFDLCNRVVGLRQYNTSLADFIWKNADDLWGDFKYTDFGKG